MRYAVRLLGEERFWACAAGSNDGAGADHVWSDRAGAATFATEFDATCVARWASRDGRPCAAEPALPEGEA